MSEERPTITTSRVVASEVVRHTFTTVRRGFDPHEVRSYLELIARELQTHDQEEQALRQQVAELEELTAHPVLDEASLTAGLGQQSAALLRDAHERAAQLTQGAEQEAATIVREAQRLATEAKLQAESAAAERIAEADLAVGAIQQEARDEATAHLASAEEQVAAGLANAEQAAAERMAKARAEADAILAAAREQGRGTVEQAQEARREILTEMAQRRRAMTIQIEQFRAARDELAAAVLGLRTAVDDMVRDLSNVDERARAAAAEVAGRHATPSGAELIAEVDRAETALDEAFEAAARTVAPDLPGSLAHDASERAGGSDDVEDGSGASDTEMESVESVEALFARLRTGHGQEDRPPTEPAPSGPPSVTDPGELTAAAMGSDAASPDEGTPPSQDEILLAERAQILDPIVAQLSRKMKRVLQDDQNRLLDELRAGPGTWSDGLLPPEDEQRRAYGDAAAELLGEAASAGAGFAMGPSGVVPQQNVVDALAERLAETVVALLRRRLTSEVGPDDPTERVGAAYREWRGERIERLVGDHALGAFSAGVLSASGGPFRWVVGGSGSGCADCDDNALAGELAPGEEFPTGHRHPPAHAGCRCMIVPTPS